MIRTIRLSIVMMGVLSAAGEARAQYGYGYPYGYGRYGWGGWGSTPGSSMVRGLGMFSMGRGYYNLGRSEALSIDANTAMRWNSYVSQATQAAATAHASRVKARMERTIKLQAEIQDRLRNHPEQRDITDGDALNVLLDVLLNPASADLSLQQIKTPLRSDAIRDIPFEYASEGMTVCLDRMTMDGQWPLALRVDAFRPEREGLRKAVSTALEEDKDGNLEPDTIQAVQTAIDQLRKKFESLVPQNSPDYLTARDTIKAMNGLTKMLYSPVMEKVLAELEDYQGTTLGDLLGFMQAFNLRFAPANSYRQRQIYLKLYPMLAEQANGSSSGSVTGEATAVASGAVKDVEKAGGAAVGTVERFGGDAIDGLKSAAIDLFRNMKL
jgi:hypothetical protein